MGIGEVTRTGGLGNMRARAEELGGEFATAPGQPQGTILTWSVPL
jgi:signal transduction histidine kinase